MGLNWLITGGCGFIGTSLIRTLVAEGGHKIRVLDNLMTGNRDDLASVCTFEELVTGEGGATDFKEDACQLVVGDILDEKLAVDAAREADVIVHLAANTGVAPSVEDPRSDCMANVVGTLNMLEAARQNNVSRFVFASSGAPVGEVDPPIHEELPAHPVSPYGASKLAGEGYCSAYKRTYGIDTVALRFSNVYGPASEKKESVVAKFIKRILSGDPLEIYGDGSQTRDFIYIDDLISAIYAAATRDGIGGEVFQIATGQETTLSELTDRMHHVAQELGIKVPEVKHESPRLGDVKRNYSDTRKAAGVLGWEPKTDLYAGLLSTFRYFIKA